MRPELFSPGDKVLLLGEGNFSFSLSLCDLGLEIDITSTCFESTLSPTQIHNSELLKSRGVSVLMGIDATKVHEHASFDSKKFDKIIFNFPHTGGKMKIHHNRELLRLFFLSASTLVVSPGGRILVTLCHGQGADYIGVRKWSDTWQIVDMAGHANLLLVECSPFEWTKYPLYTNVGYRSLEKGFHSEGAMVHSFSHVQESFRDYAQSVIDYYTQGAIDERFPNPLILRLLNRNSLKDVNTPTAFFLSFLVKYISAKYTCKNVFKEQPLLKFIDEETIAAAAQSWRESNCDVMMYSVYVINEVSADFKQAPVATNTLLLGLADCEIFVTAVRTLMSLLCFSDYDIMLIDDSAISIKNKKVLLKERNGTDQLTIADLFAFDLCGSLLPVLSVNVDPLVMKLFAFNSWRQLWARSVHVTIHTEKPIPRGICPYPVCYTFDITFVTGENFTESCFLRVLWDMAGEVISDVSRISEYTCPRSSKRSLCYRLSYLSYEFPLCAKSVIDYHRNVLGHSLETILGVCVK